MKLFKMLYITFLTLAFISCDKEKEIEEDDLLKGIDSIELKFEIKTKQDQMGDFAENAMIEFNGKIWSYGGVNDYGGIDSHFAWSSDNGINWITTGTNPISLSSFRKNHTVTLFNNELYLIGGEDASDNAYGDIWKSADGINWTNVHASAPFGLIPEHETLVFNNKMFVIAGNLTTNNTEVWSTINGTDWVQETPDAFSGRSGQKGIVFNNAMYIVGGEDISGRKLNEIWTSTNGSSWTQVNFIHFPGRNAHTVNVYDNKVWVIGGKDASIDYNSEIWYSENMSDWTIYTGTRPSDEGINSHTILNYLDKLWLFGGYQNDGTGTAELRGEITTIEIN